MSFNKQLNWAVLGTGVIANEMAQALQNMGKKLYAVGNRTHSKAIDFAKKYGIEKVYDDFQDIFTDPDVDIIYLTTPHNTHYPFMKKALENHKHLFVEKSITLNSRELNECVKLAQENNLILAEAMTIWHMPIYKQLWEMIHNNGLHLIFSQSTTSIPMLLAVPAIMLIAASRDAAFRSFIFSSAIS